MKKNIQGRVTLTSKGDGYVRLNEEYEKIDPDFLKDESIFIDHEHLNCALHGDIVEVEILGKNKNETAADDEKKGRSCELVHSVN